MQDSKPICSTQVAAYKLFSEGKNPVQVAIELNLTQPEVTQYQREYWKLNGLSKLESVYKETMSNIFPIVKIHTIMKSKGITTDKLFEAVEVISKLDYLKYIYELREEEFKGLENQIQMSKRNLRNLNDGI